jgi:hypothetical protein
MDDRLRQRPRTLVLFAIFFGLMTGWFGWMGVPTFAWNFHGNWILLGALGFIAVAPSLRLKMDDFGQTTSGGPLAKFAWIPMMVAAIVLVPVTAATTWSMFHDDEYRNLIGEPAESEFSADVAPVDIRQVRTVDQTLAEELGSRRIEENSGLGSRVRLGTMNIQTIDGCFEVLDGDGASQELCFENELMWVGPLDHSGFFKSWRNVTTPGYVMVSATDSSQVHLVMGLVETAGEDAAPINLQYLGNGVFENWVHRHVRTNGYASVGLTDYSFEIDNSGRPFWVITKFDRTIGFAGDDPTGVVVVDVQTGDIVEYDIAAAPAWIDRIQPEHIVVEQLSNWGKYVLGYFNAWIFGKREDIVRTTPGMSLVYGSDGRSYWYSGLQSAGADTGTNSFVLIDTRTGDFRRYDISGVNETAARRAAETAPSVAEAGYQGTNPILYNIGGEPTYFLALKGTDGLVKRYAFVSLMNAEIVGIGNNPTMALRGYQNALISNNRRLSSQGVAELERFEGVIAGTVQVGETIYLRFEQLPDREFLGTNDISPELKWAEPGMEAIVLYQAGNDTTQQIFDFDLPALDLSELSPENL